VSRRIQIVLPDPAAEQLRDRAAVDGTPPSTLAAHYVRERLHGARAPEPAAIPDQRRQAGRPAWLEPFGGSRSWRAETWGSIVALRSRYPRALTALKDGWWSEPAHVETLCALALWRAQLDTQGRDPRDELAFHDRLAEYAQTLKAEAGGVANSWEPGAPPPEWLPRDRRARLEDTRRASGSTTTP
jgi:hypothetical protein